ncbi:class I SAM-dependent methyltransferase [Paenibacillus tarimensis]
MQTYVKEYYEWQHDGTLSSAKEIVPFVLEYIQPQSVIDVGCGLGAWLSVFQEYGVQQIFGVDGAHIDPSMLKIPQNRFSAVDLEKPFHSNAKFDLVVSLEVAEHLPVASARTFIDSLVKLGPAVLFSAAIPFQGGLNHINEQWPEFWARYFLKHGYEAVDCIRKRIWDNKNVEWWYAQNMLIFAKRDDILNNPVLKKEYENTHVSQLSLVHPRQYLGYIQSNRTAGHEDRSLSAKG